MNKRNKRNKMNKRSKRNKNDKNLKKKQICNIYSSRLIGSVEQEKRDTIKTKTPNSYL